MSCDGTGLDWIAALDKLWKNAQKNPMIIL